jgi:hypothetical protein
MKFVKNTVEREHFEWTHPILGFVAGALIVLSFAKPMLIFWQLDRVTDVGVFWCSFARGVCFDIVLLAQLIITPILLIPLFICNNGKRFPNLAVLEVYESIAI